MKEMLQIGVPCGRNSELFVGFLVSTIDSTVSKEYDIEYIFGINQRGINEEFLSKIKTKYKKRIVTTEKLSTAPGTSSGHGDCLDLIFKD